MNKKYLPYFQRFTRTNRKQIDALDLWSMFVWHVFKKEINHRHLVSVFSWTYGIGQVNIINVQLDEKTLVINAHAKISLTQREHQVVIVGGTLPLALQVSRNKWKNLWMMKQRRQRPGNRNKISAFRTITRVRQNDFIRCFILHDAPAQVNEFVLAACRSFDRTRHVTDSRCYDVWFDDVFRAFTRHRSSRFRREWKTLLLEQAVEAF